MTKALTKTREQDQGTGIRGQASGVRGQGSGTRNQGPAGKENAPDGAARWMGEVRAGQEETSARFWMDLCRLSVSPEGSMFNSRRKVSARDW